MTIEAFLGTLGAETLKERIITMSAYNLMEIKEYSKG